MTQVFKNNVRVVLANNITASDTSITVINSGQLPMLAAGEYFLLTLDNGVIEVVKVTQVAGNTLVVVRGQEGTTPTAYAADTVGEIRVTAEWLNKVETLINDSTVSDVQVYSSAKVQELHDAQQEAISTLSGASATFGNTASQVVPKDPAAFTDLVWSNYQGSTNSNVLELGTHEFILKKEGNYSFLNSLSFHRSGSSAATAVTFELYNKITNSVLGTYTQDIDMAAGTTTSVPMNAVLSVVGSTPVTVKVRMRMTNVGGTLTLTRFSSILAAQSITTDVLIADGQVSTTKVWSSHKVDLELQAAEAKVVSKNAPTGAALMPTGNTAQRPVADPSGAYAYIRYNSEYGQWEGSPNGSAWSGLGGATGGAGNPAFYENDKTITANYTITTGKNAMTAGPVVVANNVTVTVPDGSTWTVV